jgi:hypothetical protein
MLRYGAMDAKNNRLRFSRKIRLAHRPFHSLDANFGSLDNVGHESSISLAFVGTQKERAAGPDLRT